MPIGAQEIQQKAQEFGIHPSDVQRDYVFGWLIAGVFHAPELSSHLVLKGGNAFRKGYFPTARFSDDLDFSTATTLEQASLLEELNQVCVFAQERSGVRFDLERNRVGDSRLVDHQRRVYKARLYFQDFSGNADQITLKVRMDVTEQDRLILPATPRLLIHQYSDSVACSTEIRCVAIEEALADKLKCLLQRRHSHDVFDLLHGIFINRALDVDRGQVVKIFLRKTIFEESPLAALRLLLGLPLEGMRPFWDKVICPQGSRLSFDDAVTMLTDGLRTLFQPFSYGQNRMEAYFRPEYRIPILQAGSNLTLLRLTYDGVPRLVEPYSLAFKRRKDGVAQEYFYAWDRTGGRSGEPGIRSFVQSGVQVIENTDEYFEPRFEVELRKAGEPRPQAHFGSTSTIPKVVRRRSSATASRKYIVQCPYCGKRFTRTRPGVHLNSHKDTYGNRCYGRTGIRVV